MSGDQLDLDAIEARSEVTRRMLRFRSAESDRDVMRLVAEVRRLRDEVRRLNDEADNLQAQLHAST